jgi:hypothetical protein
MYLNPGSRELRRDNGTDGGAAGGAEYQAVVHVLPHRCVGALLHRGAAVTLKFNLYCRLQ